MLAHSAGGTSEFAGLPCKTGRVECGVRTSGSGFLSMRIIVMIPAMTEHTGGAMTNHIIGWRYHDLLDSRTGTCGSWGDNQGSAKNRARLTILRSGRSSAW